MHSWIPLHIKCTQKRTLHLYLRGKCAI